MVLWTSTVSRISSGEIIGDAPGNPPCLVFQCYCPGKGIPGLIILHTITDTNRPYGRIILPVMNDIPTGT
jgi:hypothetical protein